MPGILEPLKMVQAVDLEIHALQKQKTALPKALEEKRRALDEMKADLAAKQDDVKKSRMEADRKEMELKEREEKIARLNLQLNTVKTNKEYTILKEEIAAARADCSLIEDAVLVAMTRGETIAAVAKAISVEIAGIDQEVARYQKEVDDALAVVDGKIETLRGRRSQHLDDIPPEVLSKYNQVLGCKNDGRAMAQVAEGVCQGCFMEPTAQDVNLIMGGRVVSCKTCGRILYL